MPHRHGHVLATWHKAGKKEVEQAIKSKMPAKYAKQIKLYYKNLAEAKAEN